MWKPNQESEDPKLESSKQQEPQKSKRITAIDKYIYKKLSSQPLHSKYQIPKLNKNAYTHYYIKQKKYPKELESLNKKLTSSIQNH